MSEKKVTELECWEIRTRLQQVREHIMNQGPRMDYAMVTKAIADAVNLVGDVACEKRRIASD